MYQEFFNLAALPFENTPDPRFFYASDQHREALAAIEYAIRLRKGYVLITGGIGSGKTTVGRTMCDRCAGMARIIHVMHGPTSPTGLLREVLRALSVEHRREDEHARLLELLRESLVAHAAAGQSVVLFVDEAQTLRDAALEELRLLSNLDTATQKLIQVVLVGHPELRQRVCHPRFDALRQRIVMAKQLQPLSLADTRAYIDHRLRTASADAARVGVSFAGAAVEELYRFTGGTPRVINFACDNALLLAFVREVREVTPAMVRRVVDDMLPSFGDWPAQAGEASRPETREAA